MNMCVFYKEFGVSNYIIKEAKELVDTRGNTIYSKS